MAEILLGLLAALLIFALLALMAVRLILAAAGGKESMTSHARHTE